MNITGRIAIIVVLAVAVGAVVMARRANTSSAVNAGDWSAITVAPEVSAGTASQTPAAEKLPRLLDLGATACIQCKMMAPILEELKKEYAGKIQVNFIDVWKNPAAGVLYGIDGIPTQIFFDASGKELYRHQGFIDKADIMAKWKELGLDLPPAK